MTGEQILRGMTFIDDIFIREAAPAEKKQKDSMAWIRYAAAACICLAFAGTILWQVVRPVTASAFEIEDGVLLAYHGEDTEVVIPDEVTKIASSTFEAAPSPDSITSIVLGANVETIDPLTFAKTTALENIVVPEENKNFYYKDGVLLAADGSIVIDTTRAYKESLMDLINVLDEMSTGEVFFGEEVKFVFGKAEITVKVETKPTDPALGNFFLYDCFATAIDFDGAHLEIEHGVPMISNTQWDFLQTDEMLIYFCGVQGIGETYLLTGGKVHDISNAKNPQPNDSIISYDQDEDGTITYLRRPRKYIMVGGWWDPIMFCTGYDELCREEGYVSLEDGTLVYTPTAVYTVEEKIDIQSYFDGRKKGFAATAVEFGKDEKELMEIWGYPPCDTLDELLAYNKEHYESWK